MHSGALLPMSETTERISEPWGFPATTYMLHKEYADSRIVKHAIYSTGRAHYMCPDCSALLPDPLSHDDRTQCKRCGLGVTLHGNRFTVDREPFGPEETTT